jgi:glucose/arabinose dehydrogenase
MVGVKRVASRLTAAAALAAALSGLACQVRADGELRSELFVSGLVRPLFVTFAPGDTHRVFVVQKTGQVRVVLDGTLLAAPFLDIGALVRATGYEQGLLGLAFHPNYSGDSELPGFGEFFVNYTAAGNDTVIARYCVSTNPNVAEPAGAVVLTYAQPQSTHNGGWMAFGADGYLYISSGDGGGAFDRDPGHTPETGNAQDTTKLLGKILRIDVNGDDFPADDDRNYAIPPTNPFVAGAGADEIWAYGLRNPWRCAFDPLTNDLYIGDVGQAELEEINFLLAGSAGGENYGWRCMEGSECTGLEGCICFDDALTDPIHAYAHPTFGQCRSVTGGEVYRGSLMPGLAGTYFFADFCTGQIWSLRYDGASVSDFQERTCELRPDGTRTIADIASFGRDALGELYICDLYDGEVFKIVPSEGILSSFPPDGSVDARRPSDMDGMNAVGWSHVELTLDVVVDCLTALDFAVMQQGGKEPAPPGIAKVAGLGHGRIRVDFDRPIEPEAWTSIEHVPTGSSVRLGYLPGDVNGDGAVTVDDIDILLAVIRGAGGPAQAWSVDIDRSGRSDQIELLTLLDLLVGAGAFQPYFGATLP